jgi:phage tail-like protein
MDAYYPPAGFRFSVTFSSVNTKLDASFSEVAGLEAERPAFEVREGGENRFVHRLPDRARYGNLVLKRGLMVRSSQLADWCTQAMEGDLGKPIKPKDLVVHLLGADEQPLMAWNVKAAWPVKWGMAAFVADQNALAVESLELAYSHFTRLAEPAARIYPLLQPAR